MKLSKSQNHVLEQLRQGLLLGQLVSSEDNIESTFFFKSAGDTKTIEWVNLNTFRFLLSRGLIVKVKVDGFPEKNNIGEIYVYNLSSKCFSGEDAQ